MRPGVPSTPVEYEGTKYYPLPVQQHVRVSRLGLGASVAEARVVTDAMLRAASEACANSVNHEEMARGRVFPSVDRIRDVSLDVAVATVESALRDGLALTREERSGRASTSARSSRRSRLPGLRAGGDGSGLLRQLTAFAACFLVPRAQIRRLRERELEPTRLRGPRTLRHRVPIGCCFTLPPETQL